MKLQAAGSTILPSRQAIAKLHRSPLRAVEGRGQAILGHSVQAGQIKVLHRCEVEFTMCHHRIIASGRLPNFGRAEVCARQQDWGSMACGRRSNNVQ